MKKIFSAFLLMTMMVASVGSFVSCSDIEESIAAVDEATKNNADAVEALKSEVAALKTALATAQADAAAAKTEANAAKQAAATAKAEAIAAALAEIEKVNGDVDAMQAVIDSINAALTGKADKATVELLQATLDEYKALNDAAVAENAAAIAALEEALAALGENIDPEQFAEVVAKMEAIDAALIAFQSRIQSIAYVPQRMAADSAVVFTVGKEHSDYIIKAAYQVSPAKAAAELKAEDIKAKGLAVKAEAPAEFETKLLSVDENTGMVEVLAYIPEETVKAVELMEGEKAGVVIALAIENENGVEITSSYEKFPCATVELETVIKIQNNTHEIPYDTAAADSKVDLINSLEFVVNYGTLFDKTPLAEALAYIGMENYEVVRTPENRFGTKYIKVETSKYNNGTAATTDDFEVLKATQSDDKKNVTAEFAEAYATVADATKLIGQNVKVTLSKGFFTIADQKLDAVTITYKVVGKENKVAIEIEDVDSPWIPVATFIDVAYDGIAQKNFPAQTVAIVDADGKKVKGSDNNDVTATITTTSHDDLTVEFSSNFVWPEETTTYTVAGEFNGDFDDETSTQTVYTYEFTVTVEGRPEDVEYEYAPATLPTLTLTAMPDPNDNMTLAELVSKVYVGTIVTDITEPYASYYEEDVLFNEIKTKLQAADWKVYNFSVATDEVGDEIVLAAPAANVKAVEFAYDEDEDEVENSLFKFNYSEANYAKIAGKALQVKTTIYLNGVAYIVAANVQASAWAGPTAFGLEYGKYDATTLKGTNPFTWTTKAGYWIEDMGTAATTDDVRHNYNYVEVAAAAVDGTGATVPYTFGGESLNLADFIEIVGLGTRNLADYYLRISNVSAPCDGSGTATDPFVYDYATVAEVPYIDGVNGTIALYVPATAADVAASATDAITHVGQNILKDSFNASYLPTAKLHWNNSNASSISFKVELVKAANGTAANAVAPTNTDGTANPDYIDALTVNFSTPAAINNLEIVGTDVAYEYKHGEVLNINFAKHIKVTDLFGEQVNNTVGTWQHVWSQYAWNAYDGEDLLGNAVTEPKPTVEKPGEYERISGTREFFSKAYDQEISFVGLVNSKGVTINPIVKIECNKNFTEGTFNYDSTTGVATVTGGDYAFDETYGMIAINSNLASLNGEVTFTVRVELSYMNDNYDPIAKDITVKVVNAQ